MPEPHDQPPEEDLSARMRDTPGLASLVSEAQATWRARAEAAGEPETRRPGWRAFEDSFPTFYEFTNRPR